MFGEEGCESDERRVSKSTEVLSVAISAVVFVANGDTYAAWTAWALLKLEESVYVEL